MRKRRADELLWRTVEVRSVSPYVSVHPAGLREKELHLESNAWLNVHGELDEPVKDVFDITIHVHAKESLTVGTARPVSVGAIIGVRDRVSAVIDLLPVDLDRLWVWALSGHLQFASLTFTQPRYGSALIVNTSFSSEREE